MLIDYICILTRPVDPWLNSVENTKSPQIWKYNKCHVHKKLSQVPGISFITSSHYWHQHSNFRDELHSVGSLIFRLDSVWYLVQSWLGGCNGLALVFELLVSPYSWWLEWSAVQSEGRVKHKGVSLAGLGSSTEATAQATLQTRSTHRNILSWS